MSRRKVLVKRLVCIEDLGNVDVLFTDKTGTLTMGRIDYMRAVPAEDAIAPADVLRWGLLCTENTTSDGRRRRREPAGSSPVGLARLCWRAEGAGRPHPARGAAVRPRTTDGLGSPARPATAS